MTKIISIINNKGGTGKTTTCLNLGVALATSGNKVLLIDLDSQCNLSSSFGITHSPIHSGHLLTKDFSISDAILQRENIYLIPSSPHLLDYEYRINNEPGREYILKEALEEVKSKFDYILIDNAPSLGTLAINSLVASNYYIVPMQAENFAFMGLDNIVQISDKVKKRMNPEINMAGILFIKYLERSKFSKAILKSLMAHERYKNKIFESKIRSDVSLMTSTAFGKSIFTFKPNSRGAEDYNNLVEEITKIT